MWGKVDRKNEFLKNITVTSVFLLVLLQAAVFVHRALEPVPVQELREAEADTVFIRDTVFLPVRGRYASGRAGETRGNSYGADIASGNINKENGPGGHASVRVQVEAGADRWKWDVVELNSADSARLDELPGIGGYFAKGIVRYRERLGGFVCAEQLMEIRGMDSARFVPLASRVRVDTSLVRWIDLSADPEDTLARHPYIGRMAARGIVRLRGVVPPGSITPAMLVENGIMDEVSGRRVGRYVKK